MVSAVFHPPTGLSTESQPAPERKPAATLAAPTPATKAPGYDWRGLWLRVIPPVLGLALLVGLWALIASTSGSSI
ncbi:MAG: nitrate ABC transporter, permease protein, partial [Curvibacter sp.]